MVQGYGSSSTKGLVVWQALQKPSYLLGFVDCKRTFPSLHAPCSQAKLSEGISDDLDTSTYKQNYGEAKAAAVSVTLRLPGRIDSAATTFASANDLASAMRRASAAHGKHEERTGGQRDENWPDWYAAYMVAEQAGGELPQ